MTRMMALMLITAVILGLASCDKKNNAGEDQNLRELEETLKLLKEAVIAAELVEATNAAVLVMGNVGCGKTTLVKVLINDTTLVSEMDSSLQFTIKALVDDAITAIEPTMFDTTVYVDELSETVFLDCPEFGGAVLPSKDIARSFGLHKIIEKVKSVKFLIVVDYESVLPRCKTNDFLDLLRHVSSFIHDVKQFKNSILLAVTNVPNEYDSEAQINPNDETIIQGIKLCLEGLPLSLQVNNQSTLAYEAVIDIFANNVALFRQPDEEGLVSNIELIQLGRSEILRLLEEDDFLELEGSNFGYFISHATNSSVGNMTRTIANRTQNIVTNVLRNWNDQLIAIVEETDDIFLAYQIFNQNLLAMKDLAKFDGNSVDNPKEFIKTMVQAIGNSRGVNLDQNHVGDVSMYMSFIDFFESVSKRKVTKINLQKGELNSLIIYTAKYSFWYSYLNTVFDYVTSLEGSLEHKYILNEFPELKDSSIDNFAHLFKLLREGQSSKFEPFEFLRSEKRTTKQFQEFMQVFLLVHATCVAENNAMYIVGAVITLDVDLKICNLNYPNVYIFATKTVYIQSSKEFDYNSFSIVAPSVQTFGRVEITLRGKSGNSKPTAPEGSHGEKGFPGEQSGDFVIITENLKGSSKLKIITVGGNGGAGQDAGTIALVKRNSRSKSDIRCDIKNVKRSFLRFLSHPQYICWKYENAAKINCDVEECSPCICRNPGFTCAFPTTCCEKKSYSRDNYTCLSDNKYQRPPHQVLCPKVYDETQLELLFETQKNCQPLNGGTGGDAGNPGSVKVLNFVIPYDYSLNVKQAFGDFGDGGNGRDFPSYLQALYDVYKGQKGKPGTFVTETFRPQITISNDLFLFFNYSLVSVSTFTTLPLLQFYLALGKNQEMIAMSGTYNLLRESLLFFRFFDNKTNHHAAKLAIPFYKTLSQRVLTYSKIMKFNHTSQLICVSNQTSCKTLFLNQTTEDNTSYKQILAWLYTSILAKISNLESSKDNNLVIDNKKFLSQTESILDIFLTETWQNEITAEVQKATDTYKLKIDAKIEEGLSFIKDQLQPKINATNQKLQIEIERLVEAINKKIKAAQKTKADLVKTKEELKTALNYEAAFGVLKMFGSLATMFGPYGKAIGGIVETSADIALSVGPSSKDSIEKLQGLQSQVQDGLDRLNTWQNNHNVDQMIAFDQEINLIKEKAKQLSNKYSRASKDLEKHTNYYISIRHEQPINFVELDKARIAIVNYMDSLSAPAVGRVFNGDDIEANDTATLKVLKASGKLLKIAEAGVNLYKNYKKGTDALELADELIEMADQKIKQLRQFKSQLYSFINPMIEDMFKALQAYNGSKSAESLISLDVSSWKIHSKISDMRHQVTKFTSVVDASLSEEIDYIGKQIDDAMATVMTVYQRIEKYNEDKQLVDHLTFLAKPFVGDPVDKAITDLYNQVKKFVKAANAIWFYNKAMQGVKLYVFPFAKPYFRDFDVTTKFFQIETDTNGFIGEVKRHVTSIIRKINLEDMTVNDELDNLFTTVYFELNTTNVGTAVPFYVWKSETYQVEIDKLLAGEKVYMYADVFYSSASKYVVKFKTVHLEFRARNATVNEQLLLALNTYYVNQFHTGNNFFRCEDHFYVLNSNPINVTYSFKFKDDTKKIPQESDNAYKKLANGDYLLSPYTNWIFQLEESDNSNNFDEFKKFKGEKIDLLINGHGRYIIPKYFKFNDFDINSYYETDPVLNSVYKQKQGTIFQKVSNKTNKYSYKVLETDGRIFLI